MKTILIAGGTGMVGQLLTNVLVDQGYHVIILTRSIKKSARAQVTFAKWDIEKNFIDTVAISKADVVIHLAGASVATKRWSKKRKQEIVESRVASGTLLVHALKNLPHKVKTFISASAIGWYGPDNEKSRQDGFVESDPMDQSFLGTTCGLWESSVKDIKDLGIRLVITRMGIVLHKKGGALKAFLLPASFGFATILGNGKQNVSWIHHKDLSRLFIYIIENEKMNGVYNAVAPNSIDNKSLVKNIAKESIGFYIPIRIPSFILKIIMGEMSIEVLKSAKVSAQKIQSAGFVFQYPTIQSALAQLLA